MKIVGIISLSEPIPVKAECLNKRFEVIINGINGELLTPSLPNDYKSNKDGYRRLLIQPNSEINFNDTVEWGQPFSWPDGESNLFKFKIEIGINNHLEQDDNKKVLLVETEKWINRFEENLFAFGHNIGVSNVKVNNSRPTHIEYYYPPITGKSPKRIRSGEIESITVAVPNTLSFEALKELIDKTSKDKKLCPEYLFLKESQIAINENDFRKSVLDSATALEICFTNILKKSLEIQNEKLLITILKANNSIRKKRELLKTISFELPNHNYQRDVEDLRNRAIHAGIDIEEVDAKTAYSVVAATLDELIAERLI